MQFRREVRVRLDIEKVSEEPGPYIMSYGFDLEALRESIRRVGLINPPVVARNQEGSFDIISGYRRILALKSLGEREVFCEDATAVLSSPLERFLAAFYENLATRKFNDMEKAIILNKLQEKVTREEILVSFMPLLSLPSHEGTLKFYLKLLDLEENTQMAMAMEKISINAVKVLVEVEKEDRKALFQWIEQLQLNFNQQIKFIDYSKDISIRDAITMANLLSQQDLLGIVGNPRLNNPQKAKAVLEVLRVRRFPRWSQAQRAVESAVCAISMPPETSIHYDPSLEDPNYHLEIRFKEGKDLTRTIEKLHAMPELEAIPELWTSR